MTMTNTGSSWSGVGAWGDVVTFDDENPEPTQVVPPIEKYPSARSLKRSKKRLGPPQPEPPPAVDRGPSKTRIGAAGEERAVSMLVAKGFEIVERNFKTKLGELDIIARDRGTLVFIEVRARADASHGNALDAVTYAKRRRVTRTAQQYLAWRRPAFETARFDVVAITGDDMVHIVDAWRL